MENLKSFIESGILETFVMGDTNREETDLVNEMAASYKEVKDEIESISEALEFYANTTAITPDPTIRPLLLATIDYTERLKTGEAPTFPPEWAWSTARIGREGTGSRSVCGCCAQNANSCAETSKMRPALFRS